MNNINKITIDTNSIMIDKNYVYIECPLCKKSTYSRKPLIHKFSNDGNLDDRLIARQGCCDKDCFILFLININKDTSRV